MECHILLSEQFIKGDSDLRLSPDEFYVYSYLYFLRAMYKSMTTTNIDMLHQFMPKFRNRRESDNKKFIKSILSTLRQKGLINVDNEDPKYSSILHITFNELSECYYVPVDVFEKTKDPKEFMILCVVEAFSNGSEGCKMSFSDWAKILGCSDRTAINIINQMIDKGLIKKKSGKDGECNVYFSCLLDEVETNN